MLISGLSQQFVFYTLGVGLDDLQRSLPRHSIKPKVFYDPTSYTYVILARKHENEKSKLLTQCSKSLLASYQSGALSIL